MNRKFVVLTGMRWTVFQIAILSVALGIASPGLLHANVTPPEPGFFAWVAESHKGSPIEGWTFEVNWDWKAGNEGKINTQIYQDSNVYLLDGGMGPNNRIALVYKDSNNNWTPGAFGPGTCTGLTNLSKGVPPTDYDGTCYLTSGSPLENNPSSPDIVYRAELQHYDGKSWVTDEFTGTATMIRPTANDLVFASVTDPIVCTVDPINPPQFGGTLTLYYKAKTIFNSVETQVLVQRNIGGTWSTISGVLANTVRGKSIKQAKFTYPALPLGTHSIRLVLADYAGTPIAGAPTPVMPVTCQ